MSELIVGLAMFALGAFAALRAQHIGREPDSGKIARAVGNWLRSV